MASLCQACYKLIHKLIFAGSPSQGEAIVQRSCVERSAREGCHVCTIVAFDILTPEKPEDKDYSVRAYAPTQHGQYLLKYCVDGGPEDVVLEPIRNRDLPSPYVSLGSRSTMSSDSMGKLSAWLKLCDQHKTCMSWAESNSIPRTAPTRLLELDYYIEPPNVSLMASDRLSGQPRYATLSHCWGGQVPLRLMRSNIDTMKESIDFQQLPRTFQECIQVTQALGIRYLWIDCLCTTQDSEDDWQREAGLMGQVYSNCYLNIVESDARDGIGGLFRERDLRSTSCPHIRINEEEGLLMWECSESSTLEGLTMDVKLQQGATTLFKQHNASIARAPIFPGQTI
ncbi:hypothetical protein PG987_008950 [Apiospora arundinis]